MHCWQCGQVCSGTGLGAGCSEEREEWAREGTRECPRAVERTTTPYPTLLSCSFLSKSPGKAGFLSMGMTDILSRVILCCGACLACFGVLSSILALYLLDARSTPLPQL